MKASEIFGLVVRVAGFLIIIYGLWNLWAGVEGIPESLLEKVKVGEQTQDTSIFAYFAFAIPSVAFGAFCLFCADWITNLVYRNR
jgi:hypothetical protein